MTLAVQTQKCITHIRIQLLIGTHIFLQNYKQQTIFTCLYHHNMITLKLLSFRYWVFFLFMTISLKHTLISNFLSWLVPVESRANAAFSGLLCLQFGQGSRALSERQRCTHYHIWKMLFVYQHHFVNHFNRVSFQIFSRLISDILNISDIQIFSRLTSILITILVQIYPLLSGYALTFQFCLLHRRNYLFIENYQEYTIPLLNN